MTKSQPQSNTASIAKKKEDNPKKPKQESFRAYQARKEKVAEFEKGNEKYLVLFATTDPRWWKMGWNSVLYYNYIVSKRIKTQPNVKSDQDFGLKSNTGIISFRSDGLGKLGEKMEAVGIKFLKSKSTEKVKVYALPAKVPQEDLKRLRKADDLKKKRLNEVREVKLAMPEIDAKMSELVLTVKRVVRKMGESDREAMGYDLVKIGRKVMVVYRLTAWGDLKIEEGLNDMKSKVKMMMAAIDAATRLEYIELDRSLLIMGRAREVLTLIDARLGKKV